MYGLARPARGVGFIFTIILSLGAIESLAAQELTAGGSPISLPTIEGPSAPVAPATINRDDRGRATMRAFRIATPLTLDGLLDEEVYETVAAASGFIQQVPREG